MIQSVYYMYLSFWKSYLSQNFLEKPCSRKQEWNIGINDYLLRK